MKVKSNPTRLYARTGVILAIAGTMFALQLPAANAAEDLGVKEIGAAWLSDTYGGGSGPLAFLIRYM